MKLFFPFSQFCTFWLFCPFWAIMLSIWDPLVTRAILGNFAHLGHIYTFCQFSGHFDHIFKRNLLIWHILAIFLIIPFRAILPLLGNSAHFDHLAPVGPFCSLVIWSILLIWATLPIWAIPFGPFITFGLPYFLHFSHYTHFAQFLTFIHFSEFFVFQTLVQLHQMLGKN